MLIALGEIESELTSKKYGLAWDQPMDAGFAEKKVYRFLILTILLTILTMQLTLLYPKSPLDIIQISKGEQGE